MICYALNKEILMIGHESFIFRTFVNKILCSIIIFCAQGPLKPNFQYEFQNEYSNTQMNVLNRCMLEIREMVDLA